MPKTLEAHDKLIRENFESSNFKGKGTTSPFILTQEVDQRFHGHLPCWSTDNIVSSAY